MSTIPRPLLVADIGASQIRLARFFPAQGQQQVARCEPLARWRTPADDWVAFSTGLQQAAQAAATPEAAALSISIAGVVDPESQEVAAARLPALRGLPLAPALQSLLGLPVLVHNDADCAALAEARVGAGRGHAVVFCAVLGSGVGGGLVINGQLVRGAGGLCGEWGHAPLLTETRVQSDAGHWLSLPPFPCGCGQLGCIDTIGGARGLERLHAHLHTHQPAPAQAASDQPASSIDILTAWQRGDAAAHATMAIYLDRVSAALAMAVNLSGASSVPVCGGLGQSNALVQALDVAVRRRILRRSSTPLLWASQLHDQAGLLGAGFAAEAHLQ